MHPIAMLGRLFSSIRWTLGRRQPRIVRRVGMVCPHGRGPVELDILTDHDGKPEVVLRCNAHDACPPTCDQACRKCADAVLSPTRAQIIYPPGRGPFREDFS
jgi:hypothetical protein